MEWHHIEFSLVVQIIRTGLNKKTALLQLSEFYAFDFLWIGHFPSKIRNCYYKNTFIEIYFRQIIICLEWLSTTYLYLFATSN